MPDAVNAILMLMAFKKKKDLKNTAYNITSFNPTAHEFYLETKKYFHNFKIEYIIDNQRLKIVNSWPNEVNDSAAKSDWGWNAKYSLINSYKKYLIPEISKYYKKATQ